MMSKQRNASSFVSSVGYSKKTFELNLPSGTKIKKLLESNFV